MTNPSERADPESVRDHAAYVLERGRPLSQSLLWRLQREYYEREGARAWTRGIVPYYITSNPWIANAYAKVVFGWLRDSFPTLDLRHPVHIVELGCGSGRFGYLFLNRLLDILSRSPLEAVQVRYVFTDFTESTLEPLRKHPLLLPMTEAGLVEISRFDASEDREIRTGRGVLSPKTLRNPLAVIANYLFDSLPQDAFAVHGGQLSELCPKLMIPEAGRDPGDPGLLADIHVSWEERPAALGHYGDPEIDAILAEYALGLDDTTILLPCAGLRCLQNLARLSKGRLLLLSGDKGYSREELLLGRGEPEVEVHGSVSMMVNYHAFGRWFVHQGGEILNTSRFQSNLTVVAGLLGLPPGGPLETRLAFDDAIERAGPDDFFDLKLSVQERYDELPLDQLLSWIRFSGWDARIFETCFPALIKNLPSASGELRAELYVAVSEVWRHYFPIGEPEDLPFLLGGLLYEMGCYEEALAYFEESLAAFGPNPSPAYNVALCQYQLGHRDEALATVEQVLAEAPDFELAARLREEIVGGPSAGPSSDGPAD